MTRALTRFREFAAAMPALPTSLMATALPTPAGEAMTPDQLALCYGSLVQYLADHFFWWLSPTPGPRRALPRSPRSSR